MFSHKLGCALAIASAALLSACKTFSPDGGMSAVAAIAGQGLNKDVVRISSPAEYAYVQDRVYAPAQGASQRRHSRAGRAPEQSWLASSLQ